MNKKLVSLLLALMMILSVMLSGCGSEDDDDAIVSLNADSTNTRTVVLSAITGKSTTAEAISSVEEAMNVVSKKMYKTEVVLRLMTEDEYESYIDSSYSALAKAEEEAEKAESAARKAATEKKRQQALEDAKKKIRTKWATKEETVEETSEVQKTVLDENGRLVLQYPDADENQLDIVFMTGVDMFYDFYENDYLIGMDDIESEAQKDLSKYVYPTYMAAGRIAGVQYAIPSNQPLGYYTYFLVNKQLADKYGFAVGENITLKQCEGFMDSVKAGEGVSPINKIPNLDGLYYLNGEESPIGAIVSSNYQSVLNVTPENLYMNPTYTEYMALKTKMENGGYVSADADNTAIKVVDGYEFSPEVEDWDDYYVSLYSTPRGGNDNIYSGLYGISSYCMNPDRAYEIINLLNTNPTFRNAYQYGVEGVNYKLNNNGTVHMLDDSYSMDLFQTGNVYVAYPPEGMVSTCKDGDSVWQGSKDQNLSTDTEPFFHVALVPTADTSSALVENLDKYEELCKKYRDGLKAAADPAAYLAQAANELQNNYFFSKMLQMDNEESVIAFYADYTEAREKVSID